jgi:hypothetical protein|tara:strand:- start:2216 stop:2506 length:291 start_codon:yes stop_codon:yes gene_type:complete
MASHTNKDNAAGAPLWSVAIIRKDWTSANRTDLFNDSTADNFISGQTIGLYNYKDSETQSGKVAHAGWNVKTTGSGGRASRDQYECLVALTNSQDA